MRKMYKLIFAAVSKRIKVEIWLCFLQTRSRHEDGGTRGEKAAAAAAATAAALAVAA